MTNESRTLVFSAVFLAKTPPADQKIAQLAEWGKCFQSLGLVHGVEGNLSFRTRLGFIISGTGVALKALGGDTVSEVAGVVYGLNKTSVYVKGLAVPSTETILHAQVYEERPDANAIFHVHDADVLRLAEKLSIPVTAQEEAAGSLRMAEEAVRLLKAGKDMRAFVLRNHGLVVLGASMEEAGRLVEEMHSRAAGKV